MSEQRLTKAERAIKRKLYMAAAGLQERDPKAFRDYFQTPHWKRMKAAKLTKDPICQMCRHRKATQVHHKKYTFFEEHLDRDLDSVCSGCHRAISRR